MTTFKHGDSVTCTIDDIILTDAKISIDSEGAPFICQDEQDGTGTKNKLGYKFSWSLNRDFTNSWVTNLTLARPRTIDDIQVDDVIVRDGKDSPVLMRSGDVVVLGWKTDYGYSASNPFTIAELKHLGCTLKQPEVTTPVPTKLIGNDIHITTSHPVRDVYLNGKKINEG